MNKITRSEINQILNGSEDNPPKSRDETLEQIESVLSVGGHPEIQRQILSTILWTLGYGVKENFELLDKLQGSKFK